MNVFDFAMRMEEESWICYEKLAASAKSKELQTIFTILADSEREHHGHLMAMREGTDPKLVQSAVLDHAKQHIHKLVAWLDPGEALKGDADGYRHAIKSEEISIKLYEKLAEQETNPAVAEILRRLAEEERHHLEVMENVYEFVESPHTYLAWGEFSNLREY